jgi:hypothetical protein
VQYVQGNLDGQKYEIGNLGAGTWSITANYQEGNSLRTTGKKVQLADGDDIEVNLDFVRPGHVVGIVQDADGKPVPEATIAVTNGDQDRPGNTTSKPDGTFSIAAKDGANTVIARKAGVGASPATDVTVPKGGDTPQVVLQLKPEGGSISVTVLDEVSGKPMPAARMSLSSPKYGYLTTGRSDASGTIKADNVPLGQYTVTVSASGYATHEHQVEITADKPVHLDDVLAPSGMFTWIIEDNRGYRLADVPTSLVPLDGNSIQEPLEKKTNNSGYVEYNAIPGAYALSAQPAGFQPITVQVRIAQNQPGDLTSKAQPVAHTAP